ncbi:zinc finger HIT domain-containing protein 3 isoform X2 [Eleutherodactylus coqui]|uniref:zinc finger HIT domain-containing protein 3 isoform X2 n=1 Tax=Eleutherodactylus coqui TaxID=57060 RepID=UPI00346302AD
MMAGSCLVCASEAAKYRCPRCRLRYCSLGCCKRHKVLPFCILEECVPQEAPSPSGLTRLPDVWPTRDDLLGQDDDSDTVPSQKLMLLGSSQELKALLLNTHLRGLLVTLDQTENKDEALKKYMQEPLFVEFADKCLVLVDVEKENLFPK